MYVTKQLNPFTVIQTLENPSFFNALFDKIASETNNWICEQDLADILPYQSHFMVS